MFSNLSNRLTEIARSLTGRDRLSEENIRKTVSQIRVSLLEADVPLSIITTFLKNIQTKAIGQKVLSSLKPGEELIKIVYDELVAILGTTTSPLNLQTQPPVIIMVVGLQGSGKTTTIAKLAHWLKTTQKKSVLLASADIYRPAALEQLRVLASQLQVDYFAATPTDNPISIARSAVSHAINNLADVLILDTAGRLHADTEMMEEAQKISSTIKPTETLLVVDSMTGQDALNIAETFANTLPLTGVILTKTDGDARGGAALAMRLITNQPIKFIGTGEKIENLELFHPDRIASRILGMGDILSLVEEVYQKVDHEKADKLAKKFQKGKTFDLDDFRMQLQQMRNLGGISGLMGKLPKLGALSTANSSINDSTIVKMETIINSMTPKERHFPAFIRGPQKKRIALGSGTSIQEVNKLLRQFEQMQKMMQKLNSSKVKNTIKYLQGFGI